MANTKNSEEKRLKQQEKGELPYGKITIWGPYVSERQWGTVREDYSEDGAAWEYLPHDHARSRAYRWGEDGLAAISDNQCQLCFGLALWNGKDPILKERLFGLNNQEGNHGEDVKELYYYLENTPTHSYMQYLYKYPQEAFPYELLVMENRRRTALESEFELLDTGIFNEGRYFDITATYAKKSEEDICIEIKVKNYGKDSAPLTLLPTLWFRKQWSPDLIRGKPDIRLNITNEERAYVSAIHPFLGEYFFHFESAEELLFTENETNKERLFHIPNESPFVKDAFHHAIINNDFSIFREKKNGTKFSPVYKLNIGAGEERVLRFRITRKKDLDKPFDKDFEETFIVRKKEADEFYKNLLPATIETGLAHIARKAYAGILWNKQFYYYEILQWLRGDVGQPVPPESRWKGRNHVWKQLNNRDIISVPDKWEFPWFASWDLGFHIVILAHIDPIFAKEQLILITREWYMHPDGQIPAYEWNFSDVNPPVQAWAAMKVYEIDKQKTGIGDIKFLKRILLKLTINFTRWNNRKDVSNTYLFEGGFMGLDNIGVFNRDDKFPHGCKLEQADSTAWMGMYAAYLLKIALEIAQHDDSYIHIASTFYEHYVLIATAFNQKGLWDENDHFFYDLLKMPGGKEIPIKVRSLVGITSFFATLIISRDILNKLPEFKKGLDWYKKYRKDKGQYLPLIENENDNEGDKLVTMLHRGRLEKLLESLLDEKEFLSPYGIRSVSKMHEQPYKFKIKEVTYSLSYEPGESKSRLFGGNSNWRGPIWFPMNYLIIESLKAYYNYFGDGFKVRFPTQSDTMINLKEVADELSSRLQNIFKADESGFRPVYGRHFEFYQRPENRDLILFHEYFHGDNAAGLGASHQTGWTGLIATLIQESE